MMTNNVLELPGVYVVRNLTIGKEYIVSTTNLKLRARHHFYDLKGGRHAVLAMQADYDAGHEFSFCVLLSIDTLSPFISQPLRYVEAWYIIERKTVQRGYNHKALSNNDANADTLAISPSDLRRTLRGQYGIVCKVEIKKDPDA